MGDSEGVLTLWEKGVWDDQDERIVLDREGGEVESLQLVGPRGQENTSETPTLAVGMGDGRIVFVKLGVNKVVGSVRHEEMEGVGAVGFDVLGRMVSGGGQIVKVWHEATETMELENGTGKRGFEASDSDDSDDSDEDQAPPDDSSDEEDADSDKGRKRRKKRKRGKGKDRSGGKDVIGFKGMD